MTRLILLCLLLAGCNGLDQDDPSTYHVLDHTWPQWVCDIGNPNTAYCP